MTNHQGPLLGEPEPPTNPSEERARGFDYLWFGVLLVVGVFAAGLLVSSLTTSPPTPTVPTWADLVPVTTIHPTRQAPISVEWVEPEGPEDVLWVAETVPYDADSTIVTLNKVDGAGQVWEVSGGGRDWNLLREFRGSVFDAAVSGKRVAVTVEDIDEQRVWILDKDTWFRADLPSVYAVEGSSDGFMAMINRRPWSQALLAEALPDPYGRSMSEGLLQARFENAGTILVLAGPFVVDEFGAEELGVDASREDIGVSIQYSEEGREWSETDWTGDPSGVLALPDGGFVTRDNGWYWADGQWQERAFEPIDLMHGYLSSAWRTMMVGSSPEGIDFYLEDLALGSIDLTWPKLGSESRESESSYHGERIEGSRLGLAATTWTERVVMVDVPSVVIDLGQVTATFGQNSLTFTDKASGEELDHFNHGSRLMQHQVRLEGDYFRFTDDGGNDLARMRVDDFVDAVRATSNQTELETVTNAVLLQDPSQIAEVKMPASPSRSVLFVGVDFLLAAPRFNPTYGEPVSIWVGNP